MMSFGCRHKWKWVTQVPSEVTVTGYHIWLLKCQTCHEVWLRRREEDTRWIMKPGEKVPTDANIAANLRKYAAQIQIDTIEQAEMALDLVMAAQRLEASAKEKAS